ncbi:MAG: hypothetical protein L5656_00990 [Thermanaeromonas sp.]|nr:hypothetical protein [Thermanaeromonas sp.]
MIRALLGFPRGQDFCLAQGSGRLPGKFGFLPQLRAAGFSCPRAFLKPFAKLELGYRSGLVGRFQAQAGLLCKKWG